MQEEQLNFKEVKEWSVGSWKQCPIEQQPMYENQQAEQDVLNKISSLPPLVHFAEIERLKKQLAEVATGKRFLLQGGDCAERFQDCDQLLIEAKLKIILQMSLVLVWGARIPTVRLGRIAGQYGKPRTSNYEVVDGKEILAFKGDNINRFEPSLQARQHDPARLLEAHFHSTCTLNYIRALIKEGYADLHQSKHWNLNYVSDPTQKKLYQQITNRILDCLDFMNVCGMEESPTLGTVDFFSSHEGLVLGYESAVTHKWRGEYYNTGAHFLWIGDRTRQLNGAHIEYFRGIANPIGVKVGPSMKANELVDLVRILNPNNEAGKITLITRFGASQVATMLPPLVTAIQKAKLIVCWVCDPMHGNTTKTADGIKTRSFDAILQELTTTYSTHLALGSRLGGVHFEMTGEDVTECTGGPQQLKQEHLSENYTTYCDPRLNYAQSMEMAFRIAQMLQENREQQQQSRQNNNPSSSVLFPSDQQSPLPSPFELD